MTHRRPDATFLVADGLTTFNRQSFVEFAQSLLQRADQVIE